MDNELEKDLKILKDVADLGHKKNIMDQDRIVLQEDDGDLSQD